MLQVLRKLQDMLDARERRRFQLLLVMVVAMGVANMAGVAAIIPFLAVLANPSVVHENALLSAAYQMFGFQDDNSFLVVLGLVLFAVFMTSIGVRALTAWALFRFGAMRVYSISYRLMKGYMRQPYAWFMGRHSADLVKTLMAETSVLVNGLVIPVLEMMANTAVVFSMLLLMVLVEPFAALLMGLIVGCSYGVIFLWVRQRLAAAGKTRFEANAECTRIIQEAMIGVKEIKVLGLESSVLARFHAPAIRMAHAQATNRTMAEVPRHLLEGVAFGGLILVLVVMLLLKNGDMSKVLPMVGVYALAGARMMPAMQGIYRGFAMIRFQRNTLDALHREVIEADAAPPLPMGIPEPLPMREKLEFREVSYAYPGADRQALSGLTLEIAAGSTIGIVGGTGAGKTTAMDMLLGLLQPTGGALVVDGVLIETDDDRRSWRRSIGYVSQHIFISDDSVAANIAFGLAPEEIDMEAVERAARMAELHDFVMTQLPDGYRTSVGDRGARLSGGQRQRIGIARALYHDPALLVMDEATSALDNITERTVMNEVARLGGDKTVIMVAHRLSTVRACDRIFLLEGGRVAAHGTYDELIERSDVFREMARGLD
jgi:ABC-type multidrug transport system fused ATPase/permease subunit